MLAGVTDYGSQAWLLALFGVTSRPTEYYVALCTAEPGMAVDGDILADLEPDGGGYQRVKYPADPGSWAANGSYLANTVSIDFPTPTDDWGQVTHFALCSDSTGGEVYAWGELFNPQYIDASTLVALPVGAVILGLDDQDRARIA